MLLSFDYQVASTPLSASIRAESTLSHASAVASVNLLAMTCSANGDLVEVDRSVCSQHNYLSLMEQSLYVPAYDNVL